MKKNIVKNTDSYKYSHYNMYPKGTQTVYSYFESRTGAKFNKTLFFGLQYYLKEYLEGVVVTKEMIDAGEKFALAHFGTLNGTFNRPMWEYILNECGGKLPVRIKAVPEGTLVDVSNVLMTVENLGGEITRQLTNHLETMLSKIWYPSTVATLSYEIKKLIQYYADMTSSSDAGVIFSLHDFGYRGASSEESAAIGGAAHIINFMGTDTTIGMDMVVDYYMASLNGLAYSVPATEHSIMTSLGKEGEIKLLGDLFNAYPEGILSIVIDSYDYKNFVEIAGTVFKDTIINRKGKTVFRPDSGDPVSVSLDVINGLAKNFGYTTNDKGYKELPPYIGILWGDGIDYDGIRSILFAFKNNGWASSNIIFGMGGALLQKVNRDIQRFAFKSSAQQRDGVWYDIFKEPLDSSKVSKRGKLKLSKNADGRFFTVKDDSNDYTDLLVTVFENGKILKEYTFDEVRKNASGGK